MLTTSVTLLDRLRQPNQAQAWEQFIRLYTPLLVSWAKRQGFKHEDVADLTQEVLLKLIRLLPAYERGNGQSFRNWLSQVAKNQCIDFCRRVATRALPQADGLSGVENSTSGLDIEGTDEVEYRRTLIKQGMEMIRSEFNVNTWAAFQKLMVEGKTVAEVAKELEMSRNAVYLARHRVLSRLRQELDGLWE
jgi:RNA polymerase sigma-70 factor, ECF subfamily